VWNIYLTIALNSLNYCRFWLTCLHADCSLFWWKAGVGRKNEETKYTFLVQVKPSFLSIIGLYEKTHQGRLRK